jgi:hypothetical protein
VHPDHLPSSTAYVTLYVSASSASPKTSSPSPYQLEVLPSESVRGRTTSQWVRKSSQHKRDDTIQWRNHRSEEDQRGMELLVRNGSWHTIGSEVGERQIEFGMSDEVKECGVKGR